MAKNFLKRLLPAKLFHKKPAVVKTNCFKVETPMGFLMVEEKGVFNEYPGVFISFSKDGKAYDVSQMIACVEYITGEHEIHTETYIKEREDPVDIREWETGRDCSW